MVVRYSHSPFRLTLVAVLLMAAPQASAAVFGDLPSKVREARKEYRAVTAEDVEQARVGLRDAVEDLDERLKLSGDHEASWRQYLMWQRLADQLSPNTTPDVTRLSTILERFEGDYGSLELPEFTRVRHALARYRNRLADREQPALEAEFQQRLDTLARQMESCRETAGERCYEQISQQLRWLESHEQVPDLVAGVRERVARPNVHVVVAREFIAKVTSEPIDRRDPVTDCILGTTVQGTSHTEGVLEVVPAESREGIRLVARLAGSASTRGCGYNGPVRTRIVGTASLLATSGIVFDPLGFRLEETDASVSATGRPVAMWSVYRSRLVNGLVTRIGRKRAARTQEISDSIASRHAELRLERQVADEVAGRLSDIQDDYLTRFRNPLLRRDAFPQVFHTESDDREARAMLLVAASHQLGSLSDPPPLAAGSAVAVHLHESAINNLAATFLAGRTISETEIRRFLDRLFGQNSSSAVAEKEQLHITLDEDRPISLRFDDRTVSIMIRAKQFIVNRRTYYPMNLRLQYRWEQTPQGWMATQIADPEITPPRFETEGPGRLATREVTSRRLIQNMLDRELRKEYQINEFVLPNLADAYGPMKITQLIATGGWLAFSVDASS